MDRDTANLLRAPFDRDDIEYVEKQGVQLAYVGHAAVTDRLLSVDPEWSWTPVATDNTGQPMLVGDNDGQAIGLWINLTVAGVTKPGFGSVEYFTSRSGKLLPERGTAIKMLVSDAIRNGAMRFGVGLDLWRKGQNNTEDVVASTPRQTFDATTEVEVPAKSSAPRLGSAETVKPSPSFPQNSAESGVGAKLGECETCGGSFILKYSKRTGKNYGQCNGKKANGEWCNAWAPFSMIDDFNKAQSAANEAVAEPQPTQAQREVEVEKAIDANHHIEFIEAAFERTSPEMGRKWLANFQNDRLLAAVEWVKNSGVVQPAILKHLHVGDAGDFSRPQLLKLVDDLFQSYQANKGRIDISTVDPELTNIPF